MRFAIAIGLLLLVGCKKSEPVAETVEDISKDPIKKYELRGEVTRLDPEAKTATIKHEAIGDWMGAMTMEFPVKDPAEFAKLKEGQSVNGTVFVQGYRYWVGEVNDAPSAQPAPTK